MQWWGPSLHKGEQGDQRIAAVDHLDVDVAASTRRRGSRRSRWSPLVPEVAFAKEAQGVVVLLLAQRQQ